MVKTKRRGNTSGWGGSNHIRRPNVNKPDLERSILTCLSRQRVSLKAVQIAKAVGMVTAKDVNPTLYSLAKVNKVICAISDGRAAPVWRIGALPMDATSSQPEFGSSSSSWNVATGYNNVSSYSVPTDAPVNYVSLQQNYMSHISEFRSGAALMGRSAGRGIPTEPRLLGVLGGGDRVHGNDIEAKPMSENASCNPPIGQVTQSRQNPQSLDDEQQFSDAGKCIAEEQSEGDNLEKLMISCEPETEEDEATGQGDPDDPQGHNDTEMAGDTGGVASGQCDPDVPADHSDMQIAGDAREAADDGETSSGGNAEGEKDDTSAMLNDQVRLLRALSTSDDEHSNSSCYGDFTERTPSFSIGLSGSITHETPLQKTILQHMAMSSKQHCSTLHLVHSLRLGCKQDINATLYEMSKRGLISKVNETPPQWQMTPAGRSLLQDQAGDSTPKRPTSLPSDAALGWSTPQKPPITYESSPFRIPLSPAEMMTSRSLVGSTGGASSSPSPLGVRCEPLVYQRIGIGRGIQLVQSPQIVGEDNSQKLLNALKMHESVPTSVAPLMKTGSQNTQEALSSLSSESFAALNKNPVSALMEFAQSRKMTATVEMFGQTGPPHNPRFRMAAVLGGRQFPYVTVTNKKDGKKEAAEVAVRILMSEEQIKVSHAPVGPQAALMGLAQATHFDKMAALCHQAFHLVISGVTVSMPGRKVMAGLVMKTGPEDDGKVICLGSGNRCITGESLSLEGQTVNDSHAEIITRRGFLRFLYRKLQVHASGDPQTIFEDATSGKLRVKPGITFHLYITTAPCGDGALMSQRDSKQFLTCSNDGTEHHPTFSSAVMGLLRTKIEGGEGTLPIKSDFGEQTWDGIVRGERLRTMSCSDKICRWNIVGMQGALLSHFLEPIYLSSLTLGYLYEESHLSRAVCCRLVHGEPDVTTLLQSPYHVNHPQLGRVTMCDAQRETQKTKQYSVNWCEGDANAEVTDGTRGICLDGMPSQVCKSALYRDFKTTCEKLGRSDLLQSLTYLDAKQNAADFQETKKIMVMKFKATGFGMWVSKPVEEKMFK